MMTTISRATIAVVSSAAGGGVGGCCISARFASTLGPSALRASTTAPARARVGLLQHRVQPFSSSASTRIKATMPSFYRQAVWYMRGRSQYTKSGFLNAAKHFGPHDLNLDISTKHFMITGANSGLGKFCTAEFAKRGATVHMVCRNKERAEEAKQEIESQNEGVAVHLHILDMSNTRAVAEFARSFVAAGHPLDVLINNAGCMLHKRTKTEDGFEANFAVNTMGPFVLTTLLLPTLRKSDDPRVVNVSSGGMLLQKLNATDPQLDKQHSFSGVDAYSQQKRQQVVLAHLWAEEHPWLRAYSMHPGWADTPAVREALPDFYERMKDNLRSTAQGADTIIWLSIAQTISESDNGKFFQDRTPVSEHLPLAFTSSSARDIQHFYDTLKSLAAPFVSDEAQQTSGPAAEERHQGSGN